MDFTPYSPPRKTHLNCCELPDEPSEDTRARVHSAPKSAARGTQRLQCCLESLLRGDAPPCGLLDGKNCSCSAEAFIVEPSVLPTD